MPSPLLASAAALAATLLLAISPPDTPKRPVTDTYRGVKVISMPPPSSGGTHLVQMLNTLSHFEMSGNEPGEQQLHLLTEAMRRAFADRAEFMADADFERWVTPEAIAGHVLWLASEEARDITGALVPIYGRI